MAIKNPVVSGVEPVQTTSQTRADLTKILEEFRKLGRKAKPIVFGTHRKPEAVVLPAWLWKEQLEKLEKLQDELLVLRSRNNPQEFVPMSFQQFEDQVKKIIEKHKESNSAADRSES